MTIRTCALRLTAVGGMLALTALPTGQANAAPSNFSNTTSIPIPGATFDPNGNGGRGAYNEGKSQPYPSTINVSGLNGTIASGGLTATLAGITHPDLTNLDALLVGPQGQESFLFGDIDQTPDPSVSNYTLSFTDGGFTLDCPVQPTDMATYSPVNCADTIDVNNGTDIFASPAPQPPYNVGLGVFTGTDPNGQWQLYITDDYYPQSPPESGTVSGGWSLSITTTNPNPTLAHVSRFTVHQAGKATRFAWRLAENQGVAGFDLFAGQQRLNSHLIATHSSPNYTYRVPYTTARPFTLRVLHKNGTRQIVPLH